MRVATRLHGDPGNRRARKVVSHDSGCTSKEGERRLRHTPHPHRHQFPNPYSVLALKNLQRISVEIQPGTERGTVHACAQSFPPSAEFLNGYRFFQRRSHCAGRNSMSLCANLESTNHETRHPIRISSQERWFCCGHFIARFLATILSLISVSAALPSDGQCHDALKRGTWLRKRERRCCELIRISCCDSASLQ